MCLRSAASSALELTRRRQRDPLRWIRWLPVQRRYLSSRSRFRLLRTGNQLGKTTVALADLLMHALGTHPVRQGTKHGEYWIVCASWKQSITIQEKLHALLPPDRVKPGTVWTKSRGFRGKNPAVEVQHANGEWSLIRFATTRQGTLELAGATLAGVLFDEPPRTEAIWVEVVKRVSASGGWVACAMTPVGAPVDYIRQLADEGKIEDIHSRLTPEALIPEGALGPLWTSEGERVPRDAQWIANEIQVTPEADVDVRVHGEWMTMTAGRYFTIFQSAQGPGAHVNTTQPEGVCQLLLGVDHGHRPGKQVAVLMAFRPPTTPHEEPRLWILDEYVATTGLETPTEDARGILAMLARNGLKWHNIDYACGDRVHMAGSAHQKSNKDLAAKLARELHIPYDRMRPELRTIDKRAHSVELGCRWLWQAMARPGHFNVHPRCTRTIGALDNYLGPKSIDDEHHDPVDAIRYGCRTPILGGWRTTVPAVKLR